MTEEELIEALAKEKHKSDLAWLKHLLENCEDHFDDEEGFSYYKGKIISPDLVEQWKSHTMYSYEQLTDTDRQALHDEVAHILPIIREYTLSQCGSSGEMAAQAWGLANANNACIADLQRQVSALHGEVFCTYINTPEDKNKTLLGHVHNLYRIVYSLQEEEKKEHVSQSGSILNKEMPSPTPEQIVDPVFQAIWQTINTWDVNVPEYYDGYCGANGSHVMLIVNALKSAAVDIGTPTLLLDQATLMQTIARMDKQIRRLNAEIFSTALADSPLTRQRETLLGRVNELSRMAALGDVDQSFFLE